ncbi:hypothetical protein M758_4G146400 [Ceratodon purpureus]|uniref:Stress-response A/B barrel domain-containing protein n=1 Tax=Ceratodon purpureus TaxID=3225 RepID=A0A8T0I8X9_CERPU|nr:hypothetical protein KC19_4G145000 [Ceratodon purpureus]KAG0619540.1 hypothetical protein M758_4G146400 [Ceratodon purpureus]
MKGFEWYLGHVSEGSKHEGYTHCAILTFKSQEALVEYLEHPSHVAFANNLRAAVEKNIIFSFTTTVTLKASF